MKKLNLKKFFTLKKSTSRYKKISPHVYWSMLLAVFLAVNFGIVLFGVYLYYQAGNETFSEDSTDVAGGIKLNEEKLRTILDKYSGKASQKQELIIVPKTVVDPSI